MLYTENTEDLENPALFHSFIIFEPASHRIMPAEILLTGTELQETFETIMDNIYLDQTLQQQILLNRLSRIEMMLDLVRNYDHVVITKFIHKVWRRYPFFSNLGEIFLELDKFTEYLPKYKITDSSLKVSKVSTLAEDDTAEVISEE